MLQEENVLKVVRKIDPETHSVSMREFTEAGNINLMYELTANPSKKKYVLRGVSKKFQVSKYDKEVFLHKLIRERLPVPVPRIYFFDKSSKILPFPYLIMDYVDGMLLSQAIMQMDSSEKKKIFYELGISLAQLHSITFDKFGTFFGGKLSRSDEQYLPPFNTWQEFYAFSFDIATRNFIEANNQEYGKITKTHFLSLLPHVRNHLTKMLTILKSSENASLTHSDFRLFNILVKKQKTWKIVAILDFEMAEAGLPENELALLPFLWSRQDPLKLTNEGESFMKGYQTISLKKIDVVNCRKIYAPVDLFMEASYDFYYELNYKEAPLVMLYQYNVIKYLLGLMSLDEFKTQVSLPV